MNSGFISVVSSFFFSFAFVLSVQNANAGICDSLLKFYHKAEAIESTVGNVRKTLGAIFFKSADLKAFDATFFELERARIAKSQARTRLIPEDLLEWDPPRAEEPYNDVTPPAPGKPLGPTLDPSSLRFETKLAYLEVAIANANGGRVSLARMLAEMPAYRKELLIEAVNELFSGTPLTAKALQYRISDLYIDVLKWHYPHILEGVGAEQVEQVLRSSLETRLVARSVSRTLSEAGLINESPHVFRRYFESLLKGQAFDVFVNSQINFAIIKGALDSNLVPYWVIPPNIRFNRWLEIPEDMLKRAESEGLEPVWKDQIRPYLIQRYGTRTKVDLIYTHLQRFWSRATYYAFMGWLGFTLTWTIPTEVKMTVRAREIGEQFESTKSIQPESEKAILTEPEKQQKWDGWASQHPKEARDPLCPEYRFMRKIIFGTN